MSDTYGAGVMDSALTAVPDAGSGSGSSGGLSLGGAGALGLGALALGGVGVMAAGGPTQVSSIPGFAQANAQVPTLLNQSGQTFQQGQNLVGQATNAYGMAQRGELTPEQAAALKLTRDSEMNQARQTFASMGRDFNMDTSAITTQANIDTMITAQAQSYIQSTIALATSQMQAGTTLIGDSLQESGAATNILMQEGQAQIQLNKQYSDSLTAAFKAIGSVVGGVAGFMVGGPAGAMLGASAGGSLGTAAGSAAATS